MCSSCKQQKLKQGNLVMSFSLRMHPSALLRIACAFMFCAQAADADAWTYIDLPAGLQAQFKLLRHRMPEACQRAVGWHIDSILCQALMKPRRKHFVDAFCGTGHLSLALCRAGFTGHSFDIEASPSQDILSDSGFALLLLWILDIVEGGLAWFGIVCSSWVFMSRGHTKRSRLRPWGDRNRQDIRDANRMCWRTALAIELCILRGVYWIIEQPSTSVIFCYAPLKNIYLKRPAIKGHRITRKFVWLGHWGHPLYKPTVLWGQCPWTAALSSRKVRSSRNPQHWQRSTLRTHGPRKGTWRVHGNRTKKTNLKATQVYPMRFCIEFSGLFKQHYKASRKR